MSGEQVALPHIRRTSRALDASSSVERLLRGRSVCAARPCRSRPPVVVAKLTHGPAPHTTAHSTATTGLLARVRLFALHVLPTPPSCPVRSTARAPTLRACVQRALCSSGRPHDRIPAPHAPHRRLTRACSTRPSRHHTGFATVKAVLSGDMLVLMGKSTSAGPPPVRRVTLSNISAPRLARGQDSTDEVRRACHCRHSCGRASTAAGLPGPRTIPDCSCDLSLLHGRSRTRAILTRAMRAPSQPFAWASRERIRKLCAGKRVKFVVIRPAQGTRPDACDVTMQDGTNLGLTLVQEGLAKLRPGRAEDKRSAYFTQLQEAATNAQAAMLGLWNTAPGTSAAAIRDVKVRHAAWGAPVAAAAGVPSRGGFPSVGGGL